MTTLRATGYLRPLNRRQASEHLILASDGHCYSANLEEPWGTGSSILNALGGLLCQLAGIDTAAPVLLNVDSKVLELGMRDASATSLGGVYLGNRYPIDPATTAIYDFLPDSLLDRVENRGDFWKLLPIDLWLGNLQASKVLFYRATPRSRLYRSTMMFRSITTPIFRTRIVPADADLPRLTICHYGGSEGDADAERTAAQFLALDAFDMETLFDGFPGEAVDRFAPMICRVTQALVVSREAIFARFPTILRAMRHRVDAAESGRKGPGSEVTCADLKAASDDTPAAAG